MLAQPQQVSRVVAVVMVVVLILLIVVVRTRAVLSVILKPQ